MSGRTGRIEAIAVVIPAHDEAVLLGACLESVARAIGLAEERGVRVAARVALDACTDDSPAIAEALGFRTVTLAARAVGAARGAGLDAAVTRFGVIPRERVWTAHTDADSVVPPHWLTHQLDLSEAGADVVIGTVRPDFADLTAEQQIAWSAGYVPGAANHAVHGANLGIRLSTLVESGGFDAIVTHEDVRLIERARDLGARIATSDAASVLTSGRRFGRAPNGYARYLREDLVARHRALAATSDA